jgi:hypothetical protein
MDGHRFNADPHQDPTFQFDADTDPKPDPDPTPTLTHVEKYEFLKTFFTSVLCSLHCFIFFISVMSVIIFNILDRILKYPEKILF